MSALVTRDALVAEVLTWVGTPVHWQAMVKGRGADCRAPILGTAKALGLPEAEIMEVNLASYRRGSYGEQLLAGIEAALIPHDELLPGNVLVLPIGRKLKPQHLAMVTYDRRMVHCYPGGPAVVMNVPIGRSRPIHSIWSWPSLGGA